MIEGTLTLARVNASTYQRKELVECDTVCN